MEEKRKTTRIEKSLLIQYAQDTQSTLKYLHWDISTVKDISAEGVLFNSNRLFTKGEILQLNIIIPADPFNPLEAAGEVVDSFVYGHGTRLKFINLSEEKKKALGDYILWFLKINKKVDNKGRTDD